jgi:hypothetical protein
VKPRTAIALSAAAASATMVVLLACVAVLTRSLGASAAGVPPAAPQAVDDIPAGFLRLYVAAAQRFRVDWAVLAAIGKVECDHGRDPDPSCSRGGALNYAGAGGPMQFLLPTWRQYGVDGDGDGVADMWDPRDAIPAAANYLRGSGAPADYARAIYAYNPAGWYVQRVLALAAQYRAAAAGPPPPGTVVRVPAAGFWLAALPGTGLRCDARIIADVEYLLARFGLRATACFAASGHARSGEHPLGLALDAVPADGDWSRTLAAAEAFGWRPACGASGCVGVLREPFRFLGYNGYPGHGDPAHAGAGAHIHLSWSHAPAAPLTQAPWVDVLVHG